MAKKTTALPAEPKEQNSQVVQDMLREADEITNESLEASRRIKQLAMESAEVGGRTVETLQEQGRQLNRIDRNLDNVNEDLRGAEKTLTKMEKVCGLCRCPCGKAKKFESTEMYERDTFDPDHSKDPNKKGKNKGKGKEAAAAAGGATAVVDKQPTSLSNGREDDGMFIKQVTHDHREAEINENIGAVADILGDLRHQAMVMGTELDKHNEVLDRIEKKTDSNTARVDEANIRATKLLGGKAKA
ncbi:synaptosome-associated protein 25a [Capsaspora owczarzaki ATCC 30864]|uniref:Synaptosome-associated protein 25a n=1 Tax=Capsaspora owczarzaki (strain ATCC 30864) TaxID=595528 RepID=A0A0D2X203_CAPO3|nr:synaptosome-associated protein 25a [Capsaspora owczarzaki ATCC 30864]KJE91709.1 synaptosome-associated protein 25a [Capsaspora owczarzaki ATCC 30864]|eukprot:XP_004348618.2 synaptosome-associated protein 25a [Capsaspora owczarzaki ATCC 30864]